MRVSSGLGLVVVWAAAVVSAGALAVWGLSEAADDDGSGPVLSGEQALALATPMPSPTPTRSPTPSPTPTPTATGSPTGIVTSVRVPGAVLGVRCASGAPTLAWSVPDPGWVVEESSTEGAHLHVRLEDQQEEVRVELGCTGGDAPRITDLERDGHGGRG